MVDYDQTLTAERKASIALTAIYNHDDVSLYSKTIRYT